MKNILKLRLLLNCKSVPPGFWIFDCLTLFVRQLNLDIKLTEGKKG